MIYVTVYGVVCGNNLQTKWESFMIFLCADVNEILQTVDINFEGNFLVNFSLASGGSCGLLL